MRTKMKKKLRRSRQPQEDFNLESWMDTVSSSPSSENRLLPFGLSRGQAKERRLGAMSRRNVVTFALLSLVGLGLCLLSYANWTAIPTLNRYLFKSRNPVRVDDQGKGCNFPRLDPYAPQIREFIKEPPVIDCFAHHPLRFRSNFRNQLLPVHAGVITSQNETCCYKTITREKQSDHNVKYSRTCFPVSLKKPTSIPADHEFISLRCSRPTVSTNSSSKLTITTTHKDMFAFVHPKPKVEARAARVYTESGSDKATSDLHRRPLSVLVLGLDAQSHMNFQRQMPLTHSFLLRNLSAIGLQGYTKVGDNTFPNVIPLLSGLTVAQLKERCWPNKASYFDECPFIWKSFSARGYRTSFAEDATWMGIFNYEKQGFRRPPTDYYLHPLALLMAKKLGHETWGNAKLCYGPRLGFEILLDYIVKTAVTFRDKPYFQYIWANSLFHDYLNNPKLGDELLLLTLDYLKRNGYLDDLVLIVLSDHGMRWGSIRSTYQGKIEERMPTCYWVFPPWFRTTYANEMEVLAENAKSVLTTPFDVHATLSHILDIVTRSEGVEGKSTSVGQSLLRPLQRGRNCAMAGVEEHWCVCEHYKMAQIPQNASIVTSAASYVVDSINRQLGPWASVCAKLRLDKVSEAMTKTDDKNDDLVTTTMTKPSATTPGSRRGKTKETERQIQLQLTIITSPGEAVFEATIQSVLAATAAASSSEDGGGRRWNVSGEISRLNLYREQSLCVSDPVAQKFCYCRDAGDGGVSTAKANDNASNSKSESEPPS